MKLSGWRQQLTAAALGTSQHLSMNSVIKLQWDFNLNMLHQCGTMRSSATLPKLNSTEKCSTVHLSKLQIAAETPMGFSPTTPCSKQSPNAILHLVWPGCHSRISSPSTSCHSHQRIRNQMQIQCRTNTYSHTFFPRPFCLWNTLPVDVCQLPLQASRLNCTPWHWWPRSRPNVLDLCYMLVLISGVVS